MTDRNPAKSQYSLIAASLGAAFMAGASQLEIPLEPVPLTLQSYAALTVGGLLGWRLGAISMLIWLIMGAAGLPFFAGGQSGLEHLTGPTAGYLAAFPIAAALIGWLTRAFAGTSLPRLFCIMLLGHFICLVLGGIWLGTTIGVWKAVEVGILPFLPGAALKSALAALTVSLLLRAFPRPSVHAEAI